MSPPLKKQKREKMDAGPPLLMARLTKHKLHLDGLLSPGALCSNRVAIAALAEAGASRYEAFLASGRQVYAITAQRATLGFQGETGKGGVYIPEAAAQPAAVAPLPQLDMRAEIQDLQLMEWGGTDEGEGGGGGGRGAVLAATDCYGRAVVARCCRLTPDGGLQPTEAYTLQPQDLLREAGWAGISLAPGQPSQAAVARHFPKDLTLFDGQVAVRTIHTLYCPSAVRLLSSRLAADVAGGPLVAVAEGPQVSLWDVRGAGRGARVAKLSPGPQHGHLYCLAVTQDGSQPLIGAAGADRSVLVWEPRTWKLLDRWNNCSKYEITGLHFSSANAGHAVVGGMDYEVLCGEWGGNRGSRLGGGNRTGAHAGGPADGGDDTSVGAGDMAEGSGRGISFRGDAKWMGLAKAWWQDVVAGVTASKHFYVAEFR